MDVKKCFKCKIEKRLTEFYVHPQMGDGRLNKCKECAKQDVQKNYRDNIEHYREYEKNRASLPHRAEAIRKYSMSERGRIIVSKAKRDYIRRNPIKRNAQVKVGNAIRDGKIFRMPCEICGNEKSQAHHDDYSKPLDVRWLCSKHHAEWHKHNKPINGDIAA